MSFVSPLFLFFFAHTLFGEVLKEQSETKAWNKFSKKGDASEHTHRNKKSIFYRVVYFRYAASADHCRISCFYAANCAQQLREQHNIHKICVKNIKREREKTWRLDCCLVVIYTTILLFAPLILIKFIQTLQCISMSLLRFQFPLSLALLSLSFSRSRNIIIYLMRYKYVLLVLLAFGEL